MRAVAAGVLAVGAGLAVSECLGGLLPGAPSLVVAVGSSVVEGSPSSVEDFAISVFGLYDKLALLVGTVVLSLLLGALLGLASRTRRWVGLLGLAAFGTVGALAALDFPRAEAGAAVATAALSTAAGVAVLTWLLWAAGGERPETAPGRRRFLSAAATALLSSLGLGLLGRWLSARHEASYNAREALAVPAPRLTPPPGASLQVPGLAPLVSPNSEFYRVDTALVVPRVDVANWKLAVKGEVERPLELTYEELQRMAGLERFVTLACVSNNVGGRLVDNALWWGIPLADLLRRAGVKPGGTQVVGRSVDGFTTGFPTEVALDGRDAMVALGMNGEPLPYEHGFPARLVVPGLYGYVSACKWLQEIELTGWDGFDAYWVPRGWAKQAPIKTQSRIDVPRQGRRLSPGPQPVAGVAWAPTRGISRVQVRVDGGAWRDAALSEALSEAAWVQWKWDWQAESGEHMLEVRAADGTGEFQASEFRRPRPDGATGYHGVIVRVG